MLGLKRLFSTQDYFFLKSRLLQAWHNKHPCILPLDSPVVQKFFSQSVSTNMYYDYTKFENEIIPGPVVVRDFMTAVKYGWKTWYYANFNTANGGGAGEEAAGCASGGCTI